jgi:ABC-2 type transport system permease protein
MWKAEWGRLRAEWLFYRQMLLGTILNQLLVSVGAFWIISLLGEKTLATLIGLFFWQYASIPLSRIASDIWEETSSGAFEQMYLHTKTPSLVILTRLVLYILRQTILETPLFIVIGIIFGFSINDFVTYPWLGLIISLPLTLIGLIGLGLMVGGILLVSRNAINYANAMEYVLLFFSGVIVPIEKMPALFQALAPWLPLSLGVELLRCFEASMPCSRLIILLVFQSITLLFLGFLTFHLCLRKGLRRGFAMGR